MECRICNQPISFVKGAHPGRKRKSTEAVHDSELTEVLTQSNGEVVTPHPGAQRRLRIELETNHDRRRSAGEGRREMSQPSAPPVQPANEARAFSPQTSSARTEEEPSANPPSVSWAQPGGALPAVNPPSGSSAQPGNEAQGNYPPPETEAQPEKTEVYRKMSG
ncbi:MAG TPA: hypothetical protein VFD58_05205 [Blastocatellia bacterium]|nr:hypothetical protein [Blastocatellia bacterium]